MMYVRKSEVIEAIAVQDVLNNISLTEDCDWDSLPEWFKEAFEEGKILIGVDRIGVTSIRTANADEYIAYDGERLFVATAAYMAEFEVATSHVHDSAVLESEEGGGLRFSFWVTASLFAATALLGIYGGFVAGVNLASHFG